MVMMMVPYVSDDGDDGGTICFQPALCRVNELNCKQPLVLVWVSFLEGQNKTNPALPLRSGSGSFLHFCSYCCCERKSLNRLVTPTQLQVSLWKRFPKPSQFNEFALRVLFFPAAPCDFCHNCHKWLRQVQTKPYIAYSIRKSKENGS